MTKFWGNQNSESGNEVESNCFTQDSAIPKAKFSLLYIYATSFDYALFVVGVIMVWIFRILLLLLIKKAGDVVEIMQENDSDTDKFYEEEKEIAIFMLIIGAISFMCSFISVVCFLKIGKNIGLKWRNEYFAAIINRPIKWYDKNNAAELACSIDMDCNAIESAGGITTILLISSVSSYIATIIFCIIINFQLALIALTPLPLQFLAVLGYHKLAIQGAIESQEKYKVAGGIAEESFEGIKTIASLNAQDMRAKAYQEELEPLKSTTVKIGIGLGFLYAVVALVLFALTGMLFYVGCVMMENNEDNWTSGDKTETKDVVAIVLAIGSSMFYFGFIFPFIQIIDKATVAAGRVYGIISKNKKYDGNKTIQNLRGEVEFENVGFSYPTKADMRVLNGVSFKVEKGEVLAIVGQTGSGKSTIIQLIEGFYYCDQGVVKIDGVDIKECDINYLRNSIGLVSQEPVLFSTTIKENIQIGNLAAGDMDIRDAAMGAEAKFIEELEDKYETYVGIKGSQLSGGQKQRIAIARALIKNPKILLLDEATSALDVNTEKKIQLTLDKISKSRTTIIVAQRLSSIRNVNQIIVISEGKVTESGNHQSLMELNGNYSKFYNVQSQIETESKDLIIASSKPQRTSEREATGLNYKEMKQKVVRNILHMALEFWPWLLLAGIAAILSGLLFPILGYIISDNVNTIVSESQTEATDTAETNMYYTYIECFIILFTLPTLCGSLARTASLLTYDIRYKGINAILYYDQKFFDKSANSPAILSYTFSTDCENISKIGGPVLTFQLLVLSGLIAGFIVALFYDVIFTIVVMACTLVMIGLNLIGDLFKKQPQDESIQIAYDSLTTIKVVHCLSKQSYFHEKYVRSNESSYNTKKELLSALVYSLKHFSSFMVWGVAVWFGAYRVSEGDLEIEDMTIIFFLILYSTYGIFIVSMLSQDVDEGVKSAIHVNEILEYEPEISADSYEGCRDQISGHVSFTNVAFKYEGRENLVLERINFEVQAGRSLGVTGATGSGKSTISQLLLRFYDPIFGEIKIDGIPIELYNIKYLREKISYVSQEPILFKGNLLYNMKIARENITTAEIIEFVAKAQGSDIIEIHGLDNDVGLKGSKLSGGQKQRIAIARGLARRPRILVLDESTSALDPIVEAKLLAQLKVEKFTIISIAHRLRTIRNCDEIIVLEKGKIAERGTHEQLIANHNGYYYQLFQISEDQN